MADVEAAAPADLKGAFGLFSAAALHTMAQRLGLALPGTGRESLVTALSTLVGSTAHHHALEMRLEPTDWALVGILRLRVGAVSLKSLLTALYERGCGGKDALATVGRLLEHGCLIPVGRASSNRLGINVMEGGYTMLRQRVELAPGVADWAKERAPLSLPSAQAPAAARGSALLELQRMIFLLLAEAGRRPFRLRMDGSLYRPDLARLSKAVASRGTGRSGASPELAPMVWFALAASTAVGLLDAADASLRRSDTADAFFSLPPEEQTANLFAAWLHGAFNELAAIPTLSLGYEIGGDFWLRSDDPYSYRTLTIERMVEARSAICAAIEELMTPDPRGWLAIDALAGVMKDHAPDLLFDRLDDYQVLFAHQYDHAYARRQRYPGVWRADPTGGWEERSLSIDTDWMEVEGAFVRQVVGESLRWLGVTETDQPEPGAEPTRFRLTTLGQHIMLGLPLPAADAEVVGRVVVQPSFEVVVVDASNWGLLAQLDAIADRRALDRAATYQLTQQAVVRALNQGWTGQQIVDTLEAAADAPLPQNVLYTLREWSALYESLTVRESTSMLEADSVEQLERWLLDPQIGSLLGRRLGPLVVHVPTRHRDLLAGRLAGRARSLRMVDYSVPATNVVAVRDPDRIELPAENDNPFLRYQLGALADISEESPAQTVFRVTEDSVRRAAGLGWSGPKLIDFIGRLALDQLPPDLVSRVLGWSGAVPPFSAEPLVGVALDAKRPSWETLRKIRPIGRLIRAVPTPALALVAPVDFDQLCAELALRGIAVQERPIADAVDLGNPRDALQAMLAACDDPTEALRSLLPERFSGPTDTGRRRF